MATRLRMAHIHKRFGSTIALAGVDLEVASGEVHALVGENGAGKSTLMRILSGAEKPDAGDIYLDGESFRPSGPHEARQKGVAMIYQELALAPHLDVEANIMLGIEQSRWGFVQKRVQRQRVQEALVLLDHPEIRPDTPVQLLGPGACQMVEVARALITDVRVIVFDEPTSSLSHKDAEHLFELIKRLKKRGVSILYISHFLEEVQRVADRYTVLRDSRSVGSGPVAGTSQAAIVQQMVGRNLREMFPLVPHVIGEPILEVRGLSGEPLPIDVDLTLHQGEILGIFGLVGAGRTELLRVLFGLEPVKAGEIRLRGQSFPKLHPARLIARGIGLLSEDRKQEGLALDQSIADNMTYSWLAPYLHGFLLNLNQRRQRVLNWLRQLQVRFRQPEQPVSELSGGNQQKVALARLLHQQSEVLLLDEPTRGVDVGSKSEIYRLMGELASRGKAILFISSYLPELLGVCDRLGVMSRGHLSRIRPVAEWTEETIMAEATMVR